MTKTKITSGRRSQIASRLDFEYLSAFVLGIFMFWLVGQSSQFAPIQYLPVDSPLIMIIFMAGGLGLFALGMSVFAWTLLGHNRRAIQPAALAGLTAVALSLVSIPILDQMFNTLFKTEELYILFQVLGMSLFGIFYMAGWAVARWAARAK